MVDALYDLRDNKSISFGDNILIRYSGYGSSYYPRTLISTENVLRILEPSAQLIGIGKADISKRELDTILSELCAEKGPKFTWSPVR